MGNRSPIFTPADPKSELEGLNSDTYHLGMFFVRSSERWLPRFIVAQESGRTGADYKGSRASPEPSTLLLFSAAIGLVSVQRLAKRRMPLTT